MFTYKVLLVASGPSGISNIVTMSIIYETSKESLWFALRAPYGNELNAKRYLDDIGIKNFIPMKYGIKKVRKKVVGY